MKNLSFVVIIVAVNPVAKRTLELVIFVVKGTIRIGYVISVEKGTLVIEVIRVEKGTLVFVVILVEKVFLHLL